jgi:hypothetical protein
MSAERRRRLTPPARIALAVEILAIYVRVRRLMRRHGVQELVTTLRAAPRHGGAPADDDETYAMHLAWATARTLWILPTDSRCLTQSLVLTRVLARRGISSEFVLSAGPAPTFMSHAWVERGGSPLLEPAGPSQEEFIRL